MTAIDDFVEKYESKIDKIKYGSVRDFIRGFTTAIDPFPLAIEVIATRPYKKTFEKNYATKACTIGMKAMAYGSKDCIIPKSMVARMAGIVSGIVFSMQTSFVPWIATGAVDLTNLYLKKKEKKHQPRLGPPGEIPRPRPRPREYYK